MVIKNLPTNKSPETESFTGESYQTLREQLTLILLQLFKNHCRGKNTPKLILQDHHHPDGDRQRFHKKRKLQANITNAHRHKSP